MSEQPTLTIPVDTLRDFVERIFRAAGCDERNARVTAAGVVEADLRGHRIQGTDHIYSTLAELRAGRLNGHARPRIARESAASAQIDGDGATGHVAGLFATEIAIAKARAAGCAAIGLVNAGDIFMLGAYVERMALAGLAGMTFTNSLPARVHPAGGIDPLIGTNPIGIGFPVAGGDPVVIDFATSTTAVGHIRLAGYDDRPIPAGLAIDRGGRPTTDAKAALAGALTPLGGHKGYALGLAGALFSGPLVGALIGAELAAAAKQDGAPVNRGHLFVAIDPGAFGAAADCDARTRHYLDSIKASRRAPGVDEILIPGERGQRARAAALMDGVQVLRTVWEHTLALAKDLGVAAPRLAGQREG